MVQKNTNEKRLVFNVCQKKFAYKRAKTVERRNTYQKTTRISNHEADDKYHLQFVLVKMLNEGEKKRFYLCFTNRQKWKR